MDAKADPEIPEHGGFTPLIIASENRHYEVVSLLLNRGADPNAIAKHGYTALCAASSNGHLQMVELLLHHRANPNPRATELSPLDYAFSDNHEEIIRLLKAHGGFFKKVF